MRSSWEKLTYASALTLLLTLLTGCPKESPGASGLLQIQPVLLQSTISKPLRAALQATGGTPPYSWSATGPLPGGVTLSSSGVVSGVVANPTASDGSLCSTTTPPGSCAYTVTVTAKDTLGSQATAQVTIAVPLLPLKITTTSLPNGVIGQPYNAQLGASGGLAKQ